MWGRTVTRAGGRLATRLFLSYLAVIAVGLAVLTASASLFAPSQIARRIQASDSYGGLGLGGGGAGGGRRGLGGPPSTPVEHLFRSGLVDALLVGGAAAVLAAGAVSLLVARRVAHPLQIMAGVSRRIAEGHYEERVPAGGGDEISELGDSLNTMAEALQKTEARRRALLADVAHELRTPLAGIGGYVEGLTDGVLSPEPEVLARVSADVHRMQRLVGDLEELSRLDAGLLAMSRRPTAVADLVTAVAERLRPQAEDKGLLMSLELPERLPSAEVDPDRIQQVLINLIGNAIQYTDPPGAVTISARVKPGWIQIEVRDTGHGVAEEHLPRLFERFYRVDRSRSRPVGGSGLGLTIARYLVEAHGGAIWAASGGLGKGSAFSFTIPAVRTTSTA